MPGETNHVVHVQKAKNEVVAEGVNISTECGVFAIIKRACQLINVDFPNEHAGVLYKDTGTFCATRLSPSAEIEAFAIDIIAYSDGTHVDVLVNAGTQNVPAWQVVGFKADPARYRAVPAATTPIPPEPPIPIPPDPPVPPPPQKYPYKIGLWSVHRNKAVSNYDQAELKADRDAVGVGEELIVDVKEWKDVPK